MLCTWKLEVDVVDLCVEPSGADGFLVVVVGPVLTLSVLYV